MIRMFSRVVAAAFAGCCLANASDWPQWRGPDRSDVSKETGLLKKWPAEGPKRVWLFENAGNGYSGPAIANGKYFTIGTRDNNECVRSEERRVGKECRNRKCESTYKKRVE